MRCRKRFQRHPKKTVIEQPKVKLRVKVKTNRCSPGSLLGVIQGLSREQKDCVRAMGFGSLLGMKMIDVPLKIVYYVLDHFNFESLKVEFDNCEVSVDSKSVQEILGLPFGGSLLSNMDYISENNEESYMFEWKKQYGNIDKLRLKQLKNELVQTSAADDNIRINFLVLFINTFCESTSMGKCNLNPLYVIRRDTNLSSIDWSDYIVDCLVKTNKAEKESSFFYGPAAYLMLLYVDTFKFDHLHVTGKRPTIFYWMSKKIRFLEDILQESGGFGCGHVNEACVEEEFQESEYNEEESGADEVESDGEEDLCDEDEEDFDVKKVSDVEVYESKISCMYQKMEDLKKDLVVKIDEGVLKFPQSQNLKNWKLLFLVEDLSTESFDFRNVSQKYKEPILTPGFVQVNDEDCGNDFLNDGENVEDYDQGKCSGGQGDGSGPHEGNIGKNHVEGKGYYDEDDKQGSGSRCNKEEDMNLNFVVENVTKSVGLIDSQEGTDGCLNQKLVEDDVNLNLTGIDDENVEDCSNKNNDSNETRSLKNDLVPSFSLGFSQDYEGSKKSSQSQISSERMTKKKIKDRVILGNPSAGPKCVILNVDVIDASPVSFAPPLGTLEGPSKHVSSKHKDINEEATSVVDVKGKRQMKFSYVYKSPFKERLIDFKPTLTQVENVVREWLFSLQRNPGVLDSWSRILNHEEKFRDVVNSPLRLFMNSDTTLLFEYTHLNETGKYKVFKESFSRSVCGDRNLKVLKDVTMVFFPVLRHEHIYLIVMNLKKCAFEVIDNGTDDADFDDKYGVVFKLLKKSFLKYLNEISHVKANEMADKSITPVRLTMPWMTVYNKVDCGGFAMRHIESYFGEKAAILTFEINTKRDDVLKVAYEYQKVDQKIRGELIFTAWNTSPCRILYV
uniref:Ubiquitin-like protease family profile domain-containing protein n=1 Tax=Lactuca sativa TaxID=4236 RepID=A0A9R1UJU0_LACSA|nr:hypothetical protein LSAT_V11C900488800 [Lactuca sativa]